MRAAERSGPSCSEAQESEGWGCQDRLASGWTGGGRHGLPVPCPGRSRKSGDSPGTAQKAGSIGRRWRNGRPSGPGVRRCDGDPALGLLSLAAATTGSAGRSSSIQRKMRRSPTGWPEGRPTSRRRVTRRRRWGCSERCAFVHEADDPPSSGGVALGQVSSGARSSGNRPRRGLRSLPYVERSSSSRARRSSTRRTSSVSWKLISIARTASFRLLCGSAAPGDSKRFSISRPMATVRASGCREAASDRPLGRGAHCRPSSGA